MALVYIGCYQRTATISQAVEILSGKGHQVEIFHTGQLLIARIEEKAPTVLFLPLFFKGGLLCIDVIERTRELLKMNNCQIGLFAIMKEDGAPSISWLPGDIHFYLLEPFTPMQIACAAEFLIYRKIEFRGDVP